MLCMCVCVCVCARARVCEGCYLLSVEQDPNNRTVVRVILIPHRETENLNSFKSVCRYCWSVMGSGIELGISST